MGRRELLDALQREGRETMAAIAENGKSEEERLRAGFEERRALLILEHEQQRELRCKNLELEIISRAKREAALIRLRAEHLLSLRLHERACICVMEMDAEEPEALFRGLAAELPLDVWRTVRVNPGFTSLAADCFPGAEIVVDPSLPEGFKVISADGSLSVDNTLSTRLERLWPDLLPHLMAELRQEAAAGEKVP